MDLLKIKKNQIPSIILPFMWRCEPEPEPEPYYFLHRAKDIVSFATEMLNYLNVVVHTPMFGKTQFDVPASNPHSIRWNVILNKFRVKNPVIDPTSTFKRGIRL